jgi:hypothetical protein
MSTAQRTAATALANATIRPSPVDFTSRPACSAIARRSVSKWSRRMASARSSPTRSNSADEPTRSVNRIVTKSPTVETSSSRVMVSLRLTPPDEDSARVSTDRYSHAQLIRQA